MVPFDQLPVRVLIADDDEAARLSLEALLSLEGYAVTAVEDGESAWRALEADGAPRLVILDWMMPCLDGVGVCRRLQASAPSRRRYVIRVSARDRTEDVVEALDAGADEYVRKPFDPPELVARVRAG